MAVKEGFQAEMIKKEKDNKNMVPNIKLQSISSLHFSLPLSHLFFCNQFYLACLKNIIKLIVVSFAFLAYHLEGGYAIACIYDAMSFSSCVLL